MENQEAENNNTSESGQPGGKKDGMKYLQLSTTAFMFAIGLFLNLMVDPQFIKDYQDQVNVITEVLTWLLLVISIGIGLLSLLYKYIITDRGLEILEWFEN